MEFIELLNKMEIDPDETIRRFCKNEGLLKKYLLKFSDEDTFWKLKKSVEDRDYEQIEMEAHTLKGVSANLGMKLLSSNCADMVNAVRSEEYRKLDDIFQMIEKEYDRLIRCLQEIE